MRIKVTTDQGTISKIVLAIRMSVDLSLIRPTIVMVTVGTGLDADEMAITGDDNII